MAEQLNKQWHNMELLLNQRLASLPNEILRHGANVISTTKHNRPKHLEALMMTPWTIIKAHAIM